MKKKWESERKYEPSKIEILLEELLKTNGFEVTGYREYQSKTDFRIAKNGTEIEFPVYSCDLKSSKARAKDCLKCIVRVHELTAAYKRMEHSEYE